MTLQTNYRSFRIALLFGCALATLACEPADNRVGEPGFLVLEGPWPASVEGLFEIVEIADAGGDDYWAFGWIETSEGVLNVLALGQVLKSGGAENGGKVRAQVRPYPDVENTYEIIEIGHTP